MSTFTPCESHEVLARWSFDPRTYVYTRRCARCGTVVETKTDSDADHPKRVEL